MSSDNEDYPEWFKKRRSPSKDPFSTIDEMLREMEKMMDEELKNFTDKVPKEYVKERKLPDGSTVKELGPFVYGYSMKIGPDGKPDIQEFGNIKPSHRGIEPSAGREPLVDVMDDKDKYRIFAELPGVEKDNIKLDVAEDSIEISTKDDKKFYKMIPLESTVDQDSTKASYKNGVLTVELEKMDKRKGKEIKID